MEFELAGRASPIGLGFFLSRALWGLYWHRRPADKDKDTERLMSRKQLSRN